MKIFTKIGLLLILGVLMSATLNAQNMDRYITLTVQQGENIRLSLLADFSFYTSVKIVNGNQEYNLGVGTSWSLHNFTAFSTTMTIYGNINGFDCSGNTTKLIGLDISHNTALKKLYCFDNNFTTETLDALYCSLPNRNGQGAGVIKPIYNSNSNNYDVVIATTKQNAIDKNWVVQYDDDTDIPLTTGSYTCPEPNMSRYITLTVQSGESIRLNFLADADNTPVQIVSGSQTYNLTVGTDWTGYQNYTAEATTMTIYGDIQNFNCS